METEDRARYMSRYPLPKAICKLRVEGLALSERLSSVDRLSLLLWKTGGMANIQKRGLNRGLGRSRRSGVTTSWMPMLYVNRNEPST